MQYVPFPSLSFFFLQAKALLGGVPNLSMLETVDTAKLADRLNRLCGDLERTLSIMVQVNTSG